MTIPLTPHTQRLHTSTHIHTHKYTIARGYATSSHSFSPPSSSLHPPYLAHTPVLWKVHGDCDNYNVLRGHKNSVQEVSWSQDGGMLYSASADLTVGVWDTETGRRIKKLTGHEAFVNSCCASRTDSNMVASGSDDGTIKIWDARNRRHVQSCDDKYQVLAVCFDADNTRVFGAGISNDINVWDIRSEKVLMTMEGHTNTVTGIALSPDGNHVLTNAMDSTVRMWDIRPYVEGGVRQTRVFQGHVGKKHNMMLRCGWSANGENCAVVTPPVPPVRAPLATPARPFPPPRREEKHFSLTNSIFVMSMPGHATPL